jgi:hypothetical protein
MLGHDDRDEIAGLDCLTGVRFFDSQSDTSTRSGISRASHRKAGHIGMNFRDVQLRTTPCYCSHHELRAAECDGF